jgi:trehalose-6-phosphate synthase
LVAKEFVVAKEDRNGVLILSRFAGAAQELRDALIVNPYDIEQVADAIFYGLNMEEGEKRKRMTRMQETVRDNNIYRWASDLITTLAQLRLEIKTSVKT